MWSKANGGGTRPTPFKQQPFGRKPRMEPCGQGHAVSTLEAANIWSKANDEAVWSNANGRGKCSANQ
eukprot:2915756-Lingulodinium_polyedra.AAC.1